MRDSKRIYPTCNALASLWAELPDWRLGQLLYNFQAHMAKQGKDIFYLEEAELIDHLKAYVEGLKH